MDSAKNEPQVTEPHFSKQVPAIIDYRVTMLIAAGAAMKEAADALTGTNMADPHQSKGCPAEKMNRQASAANISA